MVLRIRLQSHQVHLTMLQYYTYMQYTVIQKIHTYTKMNLSTVKWAPWDKTQSRELLGLFICVCIALCTITAHHIAQNRPDNFPPYPPDNHHCSDDVCLREGGELNGTQNTDDKQEKSPTHCFLIEQLTREGRTLLSSRLFEASSLLTFECCIQTENTHYKISQIENTHYKIRFRHYVHAVTRNSNHAHFLRHPVSVKRYRVRMSKQT